MTRLDLTTIWLLPYLVALAVGWGLRDRSAALAEVQAKYAQQQAAWLNCLEGHRMRAYWTAEIHTDFECSLVRPWPVGETGRRTRIHTLREKGNGAAQSVR